MAESKTKIVNRNEFGQVGREILFASINDIINAIQSIGNLEKLGYELDTTEKNAVKLWRNYPGSRDRKSPDVFKTDMLVGKRFSSPLENLSDYIVTLLMRSYFLDSDPSYEQVDELVSSGTVTNPIAAWFLASGAARKYRPESENTATLTTFYKKSEILEWFEKTKNRNKNKTIYDAASE